MEPLPGYHVVFEPRNANGSRYSLHIVQDTHGGWLVTWDGVCTWRYFAPFGHRSEGELKFLHGRHNTVDTLCVREFLDGRLELA